MKKEILYGFNKKNGDGSFLSMFLNRQIQKRIWKIGFYLKILNL